MVKVISEYPESSMSLFIFVSEVFKFLATPWKLVIEVDDINQPSFLSLSLYSEAHPCTSVRMLLFMYFCFFFFGLCFFFGLVSFFFHNLKNQDSCLHPQGISWFNSSREEESCNCYSGREPLSSKTSYTNLLLILLFAPYFIFMVLPLTVLSEHFFHHFVSCFYAKMQDVLSEWAKNATIPTLRIIN